MPYKRETLCWTCKRGVLDCKWMACCEPVKGWTANRTRLKMDIGKNGKSRYADSYHITACPNYIAQEARAETKQCPVCRRMFVPRAANMKYCGRVCYELKGLRTL